MGYLLDFFSPFSSSLNNTFSSFCRADLCHPWICGWGECSWPAVAKPFNSTWGNLIEQGKGVSHPHLLQSGSCTGGEYVCHTYRSSPQCLHCHNFQYFWKITSPILMREYVPRNLITGICLCAMHASIMAWIPLISLRGVSQLVPTRDWLRYLWRLRTCWSQECSWSWLGLGFVSGLALTDEGRGAE